jgi:predicted phosphodiesterase
VLIAWEPLASLALSFKVRATAIRLSSRETSGPHPAWVDLGETMGSRLLLRSLIAVLALAVGCDDAPLPQPAADTPRIRVSTPSTLGSGQLLLPDNRTSIKFAVIGDSGRGSAEQREVAEQMRRFREAFEYDFVLMLGDNIYEGPATAEDYQRKFEEPYRELLSANVKFFAALGNHDDPRQISYPPFNMHGERYYSFAPPEDVVTRLVTRAEFFALDSTNLDRAQLGWLDERLAESDAEWKIVFLHHPLYTSGRYRRTARVHRWVLEPILVRHGVDVVFSGHEHIYQRSTLQHGIQYFVSGGAGSLRAGDGVAARYIARSYDDDYHFMLVEIENEALHFQAISRHGKSIDAGTLSKVQPARARGTPDRR